MDAIKILELAIQHCQFKFHSESQHTKSAVKYADTNEILETAEKFKAFTLSKNTKV